MDDGARSKTISATKRGARDDDDDDDDAVTSDDARGPMPEKSRILEGPHR